VSVINQGDSGPILSAREWSDLLRDVRDALMVARNSDDKLIRRPLSPHLQVYRWPISMALSIGHRVSGVGLAIGTLLMTWWLVAAAVSDRAFANVQWFLGSWLGLLLLFGWSWALCFHMFNGLRHLLWDVGWGFEIPRAYLTGWTVVAASLVMTALIWACIFAQGGAA